MWRYKDTLKIVISGSRSITNYGQLKTFMSNVLEQYNRHRSIVIIAGGAKGVDQLAKRYATENAFIYKEYKPLYRCNADRGAPLRRNKDMGKIGDILVALWDGESPGTQHMINWMIKEGKPTHVCNTAEQKVCYDARKQRVFAVKK